MKDLVMVPFKRVFSDDPAVRLHFEHEAIKEGFHENVILSQHEYLSSLI